MSIGKMLGKPLWEWGPLNDQPHSTPYIMDIYWDHIPVLKDSNRGFKQLRVALPPFSV